MHAYDVGKVESVFFQERPPPSPVFFSSQSPSTSIAC